MKINGEAVKLARENKGWERNELATIAGVSSALIKKMELSGSIRLQTLINVASALDVKKETLRVDYTPPENDKYPGSVPTISKIFVGREQSFLKLKGLLGVMQPQKKGNTQPAWVAIHGWPGVGKTALINRLAHDMDIKNSFDKILCTWLDQNPDILSKLIAWGRALGYDDLSQEKTVEEVSSRLNARLQNERILMIVDDVWEPGHSLPFQLGGPDCAVLVTTREPRVAEAFAIEENVYHLPVLSESSAFDLLKKLAPSVVTDKKYGTSVKDLIEILERLPLALQVAGHLLNKEAKRGLYIAKLLEELKEGKRLLNAKAPIEGSDPNTHEPPILNVLFKKSTDLLEPEILDRFARLAPMAPKPAVFDLNDLEYLWKLDDPYPTVEELLDRGLLELAEELVVSGIADQVQENSYWMHFLLIKHADSLLDE